MSLFRASDPAADADWSVPTPRGPYPVSSSNPDPDAPTQRLYRPMDEPEPLAEPDDPGPYEPLPPAHRSARSRGALLALVIAVLALLASGGASYVAWNAKGRADAMPHTQAAAPVPSTIAATSAPAPAATASDDPAPSASGYTLRYAQEPLQIKVACDETALVDLDVPRVDAPEQDSDVRYDNKCGAGGPLLAVGPGGRRGSHVTDPEADAPGCADAIDTEPLDPGESVPVQKGTVLCVRTGGADGAPSMVALVEVTGLGPNGVASLRATAWIPPADGTASDPTDQATPAPDDTEPDVPQDDVPSDGAGPGE